MSGLVPQTVQVLLGERNKKVSDKLAVPGTLTRAENVEMTTTGRYQRRPGTFSDGQPSSAAKELVGYGDELVALSDSTMYSRIGGAWGTRATGMNRHFTTGLAGAATSTDQRCHDFARGGGYDWHVWEDGARGGIRYSIKDTTTGAYVVFDKQLTATGLRPAICSVGAQVGILYMDTANLFRIARITHAAPTVVASDILVDAAAASAYDWIAASGNVIYIAYKFTVAATSRLRLRSWDMSTNASTGVVTSGVALGGDFGLSFLTHNFSDSTIYLVTAGTSAGGQWAQIRVDTGLTTVSETSLDAAFGGYSFQSQAGYIDPSTLTAHMYMSGHGSGFENELTRYRTRTSAGALALVGDLYNTCIASKAWRVPSSGEHFLLLAYESNYQSTLFAMPSVLFQSGPAARVFPSVAPYPENPRDSTHPLGRLPTPSLTGDVASIAIMRAGVDSRVAPGGGNSGLTHEAYRLDLTPWSAGVARPYEADGVLTIPGGFPRVYDKNIVCEAGFHVGPEYVSLAAVGGTLAAGAYSYQAIYSWLDATGRERRSPPCPVVSITLGGPGGVAVTGPSLQLTAHLSNLAGRSGVLIKVYRTDVAAGSGAPYYFRGYASGFPASATWLFTDNDINIVSGEELYTKGDVVLDNGPPPSMRQQWTWGGRQWGLLEQSRRGAAWSKLTKEGFGEEWNEDGQFLIDDEFGDLTAGIGLGERNLFFKRDVVYWLAGAGPDDAGNGTFSDPQRLDGAPGTDNPRSLLATDLGVFYQAPDKVVWLITPGLERIPLGDPCVDITDTITSAALVPDRREARFTTAAGTTLRYDLTHKRWMTNTGQLALASCTFGGVWHYLTTTGFVRHEDRTVWTEAGSSYVSVLELSWLSPAGVGGYTRVWAIHTVGEPVDGASFTLTAFMTPDFAGAAAVSRAVAAVALSSATHGYVVETRVPLTLQQNKALRLRYEWFSDVGAGLGIDALMLQCGFLPGKLPKLPATHRMA